MTPMTRYGSPWYATRRQTCSFPFNLQSNAWTIIPSLRMSCSMSAFAGETHRHMSRIRYEIRYFMSLSLQVKQVFHCIIRQDTVESPRYSVLMDVGRFSKPPYICHAEEVLDIYPQAVKSGNQVELHFSPQRTGVGIPVP